MNKQLANNDINRVNKPGRSYTRLGKILGLIAIIIIPALPLYSPLITIENPGGWDTSFAFIPIFIAVVLAITSVTLLVVGRQLNKR